MNAAHILVISQLVYLGVWGA